MYISIQIPDFDPGDNLSVRPHTCFLLVHTGISCIDAEIFNVMLLFSFGFHNFKSVEFVDDFLCFWKTFDVNPPHHKPYLRKKFMPFFSMHY